MFSAFRTPVELFEGRYVTVIASFGMLVEDNVDPEGGQAAIGVRFCHFCCDRVFLIAGKDAGWEFEGPERHIGCQLVSLWGLECK